MSNIETGRTKLGRLRILATALIVAVLLSGCGGSGPPTYPVNVRTNFLNSCEQSGGNVKACDCAISYIEKHVKLTTFTAVDQAIDNGSKDDPSWLRQAISSCAG
jgi:hypothetical protein